MAKSQRKTAPDRSDPILGGIRQRKQNAHQFVIDALAPLAPFLRPMFGCHAIYVEEKIVLILREKPTYTADNGVWLATTAEHHESLRQEFPHMRSIGLLGKKITGWQVLPSDSPDFEEAALLACELVLARDARIGKVPASRRGSKVKAKAGNAKKGKSSQKP